MVHVVIEAITGENIFFIPSELYVQGHRVVAVLQPALPYGLGHAEHIQTVQALAASVAHMQGRDGELAHTSQSSLSLQQLIY